MVLLPNLFEGAEAYPIRLCLPKGKIAWLLADIHFRNGLVNTDRLRHIALNCMLKSGVRQFAFRGRGVGDAAQRRAHQPPPCCARPRSGQVAITSLLHRWPDLITGKFTPSRDATQAPDYLARRAVAGLPSSAAKRVGYMRGLGRPSCATRRR